MFMYPLYVAEPEMLTQAEALANFTGDLYTTQDRPNSTECSLTSTPKFNYTNDKHHELKNGLARINSFQNNSNNNNIQIIQDGRTIIYLQLDKNGLAIINAKFKPIYVTEMYTKLCHRLKNLNKELLIQAIKLKSGLPATVWDLTAGLGRDAILMANFGYSVLMIERHPLLATILHYVISNQCVPNWQNLSLVYANSLEFLPRKHTLLPEIIYLDPMFQDKKMAKAKKEMQIIEQLVNMDSGLSTNNNLHESNPNINSNIASIDSEPETVELFQLASKTAQNKIVVKRDNKEQNIIKSPPPSYTKLGKTVRYDVYQTTNYNR